MNIVSKLYSHNKIRLPDSMPLTHSILDNMEPVSFLKHAVVSIKGLLAEHMFSGDTNYKLPAQIGGYYLKEEFIKKSPLKVFYKFGIYENTEGDRAFAKIWAGKIKTYAYVNLKNDIRVNTVLNAGAERITDGNCSRIGSFHIPYVLGISEGRDYLAVLYEYISGNTCENFTQEEKLNLVESTVMYFSNLYCRLNPNERNHIVRKGAWDYILLYPMVLLRACLTHPQHLRALVRSTKMFVRAMPLLFRHKKHSIAHRDLRFNNTMYDGKRLIPIDNEYVVITYDIYDLVEVLTGYWLRDEFYKLFIEYLKNKILTDKDVRMLFIALSVYSITHSVSDDTYDDNRLRSYINCLEFLPNL